METVGPHSTVEEVMLSCGITKFFEIRPCLCNKDGCHLCWLYHNDIRFKKLRSKLPSKVEQATNLIVAIRKRIENEFRNVDNKTYQKRLSICEQCPNKTNDWRCTKCGCYLNIKAKWESEKCPENRWALPLMKTENKGCGCGKK